MEYFLNALARVAGDPVPSQGGEGAYRNDRTTMVIGDMEFTRAQTRQMQEVNVSAGIPFALSAAGGLSRPQGREHHVNVVTKRDLVSVKSFKFKAVSAKEASLTFVYTTEVEAILSVIPVGVADEHKYRLPPGHKVLFDERIPLAGERHTVYEAVLSTGEDTNISRVFTCDVLFDTVVKEVVTVNGDTFELHTIFGNDDDEDNKCVICLENDCNTTVLPCRHQTLCDECAASLLSRESTCPICRKGCQLFIRLV